MSKLYISMCLSLLIDKPLISRLVVMNNGGVDGPYPTVKAATVIRYVVQGSRELMVVKLVVLFCCHSLPASGLVMLMV